MLSSSELLPLNQNRRKKQKAEPNKIISGRIPREITRGQNTLMWREEQIIEDKSFEFLC